MQIGRSRKAQRPRRPDPEAARRGGRPVPPAPAVEKSRRGDDREARGGRDGRARTEGGGAGHVGTGTGERKVEWVA